MPKVRPVLLVGLVVLGGLGAVMALYTSARQGFRPKEGSYVVYALFDDVSGVAPRTRVTVAGVQVGEVVSVGLDDTHPDLARVAIVLTKSVALREGAPGEHGPYESGAQLSVRSASLLGDPYLELSRGLKGRTLEDGDRIQNVISVTGLSAVMKQLESSGSLVHRIDRVFAQLEAIAVDVKKVTGAVSDTLGGEHGKKRIDGIADSIDRAAKDLTRITSDVRKVASDVDDFLSKSVLGRGEQVGRIVGNVERFTENAVKLSNDLSREAARILADVKAVTGDVKGIVGASKGDIAATLSSLKEAIKSVADSAGAVQSTVSSLQSIAKKIDTGQGTLGRLVNDDTALKNVEEVVADAGDLVKKVTKLETKLEFQSQFYVEEKAFKNYLSLRIQPKHDKYWLIELIDDPRKKVSATHTFTETDDPTRPPRVNTTTTTTDGSEFKVSFQFAKRWYFVTGRLGIIESKGGLGLDLEFLNDSLKLSMDLFDFSAEGAPRLRVLANWEFVKHFYVSAGVDDVIVKDRFDYFFGLGIRFTDDDLKSLLLVGPKPSL